MYKRNNYSYCAKRNVVIYAKNSFIRIVKNAGFIICITGKAGYEYELDLSFGIRLSYYGEDWQTDIKIVAHMYRDFYTVYLQN